MARLNDLGFRGEFRKYQRIVLDVLEPRLQADAREPLHIVAPPGAGKTIVGIELIRRLGDKAVVFAPTTTIQHQWVAKLSLFGADPSDSQLATTNASVDADMRVYTYQLISAPREADEHLREAGRQRWVAELCDGGLAQTEERALARIAELEANNRSAYRRDLARHTTAAKRQLLHEPTPDLERLLHPNARRLVDDLVAAGVRTVVLDECHHLLDYWAVVLSYLISRLDRPQVIGLTATLPSLDDGREYENYTSLLGDIDFEVPTPAVIREGNLAPHRDLVYFVTPTPQESAYLEQIQGFLDAALARLWAHPRFVPWLLDGAIGTGDDPSARWQDLLRSRADFAVAALRHLVKHGAAPPPGVEVPAEAREQPTFDDIVMLSSTFGLLELKPSDDESDHETFAAVRRSLLPFGITVTERGARQQRSPGDLVLAYSAAKAMAASDILRREAADLGDRFRALVLTDFETSGSRAAGTGLDADSGSCREVFTTLVATDPDGINPIMVTGRTVWIDADHGPALLEALNEILERRGSAVRCEAVPTPDPRILEIRASSGTWGAATYVAAITEAFERGIIRCLVGTRGLFAEGWDALTLNTLVDLTSITTSTTTQQLRGRSGRLDPAWPDKVAHDWDVICVAQDYARGDMDFRRFEARHASIYGVVSPAPNLPKELVGAIERGIMHVDAGLQLHLLDPGIGTGEPGTIFNVKRAEITERSLKAIGRRKETYERWNIGAEYDNFRFTGTRLSLRNARYRTAYTVTDTLKAMLAAFRMSLFVALALAVGGVVQSSRVAAGAPWWVILGALGLALVLALAANGRQAVKVFRAAVLGQPKDDIVLDVGRAVAKGLKDAGLISPHMQAEYVRAVSITGHEYEVILDYASEADGAVFAQAMADVFGPVRSPRYLILRDTAELPDVWLRPLWAFLRRTVRKRLDIEPAYHPVPHVLGARKEYALAFAAAWSRYVGGHQLVFTGNLEGWRVLQRARAQTGVDTKARAFGGWR